MMLFFFGVSIALNIVSIIGVCYFYHLLRKQEETNDCYKELDFLIHDNNDWDRVGDLEPPRTGAELPHTLVAAAGQRERAPQR